MNNAIFLDRDGVIIEEPPQGYAHKPDQLKLIKGSWEAIRFLNNLDRKIIIVTNQAGIAKGYYTEEEFKSFNQLMKNKLEEKDAKIDVIYHCPHNPEDNCECRKPENGLLRRAEKEFNIDLSNSWMIGDRRSDVLAGRSVGCTTIMVETGYGKEELEKYDYDIEYNFVARNLYEAVKLIYNYEKEKEKDKIFRNDCTFDDIVIKSEIVQRDKYKANGRNILICVQTFNGLKYTKNLINSIKEQNCNHRIQLFVIDNYSIDNTIEWIKKMKIDYELLGEKGKCSAAGMNKCLERFYNQESDYMLLLNNDLILERDFIGTIVDDFEEQNRIRPGCLLMCGVQNTNIEDKQWEAIINLELQDLNDEVMTGDFSAFIIKKDVIEKVGYFDEIFTPRYIEDNDYTHRIYLSGGYCIRNGKCRFHHKTGAIFEILKSLNIPTESPRDILIKNSKLYKEKWGSYPKGYEKNGIGTYS